MIPADTLPLGAAIAARALLQPDAAIMTFLTAGQTATPLTYGRLHTAAQIYAGQLQQAGVAPGAVVMLAGQHDADLIAAFLGTLYAGAVPTITPYPTTFTQTALYDRRLLDIASAGQARAAFLLPDGRARLAAPLSEVGCVTLELTGFVPSVSSEASSALPLHTGLPSAPAYVQFSSGTTGVPKGAVVSHAAALRHLSMLVEALGLTAQDVLVGWAPFYHDLGLVFYLLLPLVSGIPAVTLSPDLWVRYPYRLLQALHEYRGTVCIMPNFGFAHTTRNVRERDVAGLDLRCVRHLIAGAEVVLPDILQAFAGSFAGLGLAAETLRVGYGMTEAVFMASLTPPGRPPQVDRVERRALLHDRSARPSAASDAMAVISCGAPLPAITVAILDDQEHPLPERQVGEVVIASPALFTQYLQQPDLTATTLRQGKLHTGDLGYLADGELFIVDRKKDLIIAAGKHIYPEPLEQIALEALGQRGGRAAAFGVRSAALGTELPVVVCEARGQIAEDEQEHLTEAIRLQVLQGTEVSLADVRLVRRGWLEITTSGKVARSATREKYLAAGYQRAVLSPRAFKLRLDERDCADPDRLQISLALLAAQILGVAVVQPDDDFFDLGGDSLAALRMVLEVEEALGRSVPMEFFSTPTVRHMAELLGDEQRRLPARPFAAAAPLPKQLVRQQPARSWRPLFTPPQGKRVRVRTLFETWAFRRPYFEGVRWLMAWCSRPWVQALFYPQESQWVRRLSESVGTPPGQVPLEIQFSLVAHSIFVKWKTGQALGKHAPLVRELQEAAGSHPLGSEAWSRYFDLRGSVHLEEALQQNCGIIFVGPHLQLSFALILFLERRFENYQMVGNSTYHGAWQDFLADQGVSYAEGEKAARSAVALAAARTLAQAGVVLMTGDQENAQAGRPAIIGDRLHQLVPGFAELAVSTGAAIVPFYIQFLQDGRIQIRFLPPLSWDRDGDREMQIREIVAQHAAVQTQLWRQSPGALPHGIVRLHLACPLASKPWLTSDQAEG